MVFVVVLCVSDVLAVILVDLYCLLACSRVASSARIVSGSDVRADDVIFVVIFLGVCAIVVIFVVVLIGLNVLALLTLACAVDCVVRALLLLSSCAVDCGAVCAVDVIVGGFRIALWLLLSSCAVDCGGGVCVIGVVFVGVIGLYVRVLFSVLRRQPEGCLRLRRRRQYLVVH